VSQKTVRGIVAYPVTPFAASGDIDTEALVGLVDRLVTSGAHAVAPLGSTGESAYLTDAEWHQVAEASIGAVAGRVPTVVGVSDLTTAGAVGRARAAELYGADVVMLLPASYWKLSEPELVAHFAAVAAAISIPIMVYNNPATSGIDMSPEFLVGLIERFEAITMIKESSGDIFRMQRISELTGGEVPFFNGSNPLAFHAFAAGAAGWCTAAACLIPAQCLELFHAIEAGDLESARRVFRPVLPLLEFLLRGGLPPTVKQGLKALGFDAGVPRPPLLPLDEARSAELVGLLSGVGALPSPVA
jgi:4-hydroxy-tetrahydrodipicolinate synthase